MFIIQSHCLVNQQPIEETGIIYTILGKGNHVKSVALNKQQTFLLIEGLNIFQEKPQQFLFRKHRERRLGNFFVYYFNIKVFRKLIKDSNGNHQNKL